MNVTDDRLPKLEFTLSVDEENALTLYEELEQTDINPTNLNVNCCCGLLRTSPFHQPKSSSSPTGRLQVDPLRHEDGEQHGHHGHHQHHHHHRHEDDTEHDFLISTRSCEDDECDNALTERWRHNVTRRNERYRAFGLLESSILNSFQLQNFRRKTPSVFDSSSSSGQTSCSSTASSMIEDISDKIEEIGKLDTNIHSLMYKSVELHNDILSLEATTNRLIADAKKLSDDLDDVRFLDELIAILNGDIGPVIHREWPYKIDTDAPIEEGTPVT
ncbi:lateral signaling target protein 2 homolog [Anopheles funestus]|uniref:lateral signaling target protein 2 homolog n=1 Tax=Anopheles funestus TaxID=62324 RepID=UPI0020C5D320|nr:lateral signaling target protein 2 homolog [Anopheles funestus]XP_049288351.1 lateral signaling target protein 2 homolog [Anopheles funestus]XP_049288353.1 lateral signaling target protein 2 homolog [Anopheles funestus]XP_049288354.1 lateral signaling target protein 2 homolog [Anopheles funestus]XP_049288355.1 lateral signaling target protein 2 homolog [Anopheles funestus]XP_049288356.1 lateral signaling target protein 2 homolog [Anopheles funestus]XP_049288357.1 lateral signaling target p